MTGIAPDQPEPTLWSVEDTAKYLGKTPAALMTMRWRGVGPVGFRIGKHVRFRPFDVIAWVDAQVQNALDEATR